MINNQRQQSILRLFKSHIMEPAHAEQVKILSLLIFDKTYDILHNLTKNERDLLEAGALLHDIGYYISNIDHHKHSYELIMSNDFEGFSSEEKDIIANIARYHRGKMPKFSHSCYSKLLNDNSRQLVKKLASISRLADGLDKTHRNSIRNLDCIMDDFSRILYIIIYPQVSEYTPEFLAAEKKKDLFEEAFKIQVRLKVNNFTQ